MTFNVIVKKIQDVSVTVLFEPSWTVWFSLDEVAHLLRLPVSTAAGLAPRHKRCWSDFKHHNHRCRLNDNKTFVDLFGLAFLCNRANPCQLCDYLLTQLIAELYCELAESRRRSQSRSCSRSRSRSRSRRRSVSRNRRRSRSRSNSRGRRRSRSNSRGRRRSRSRSRSRTCHRRRRTSEYLEKISRQNDLLVSAVNQMTLTNTNNFADINNSLSTISLQNSTLTGQVARLLESVDRQLPLLLDRLNLLSSEVRQQLNQFSGQLAESLNRFQDVLRNELTGINSALNNLTSSVTNINVTLNNLLQAIAGTDFGEIGNVVRSLIDKVEQILKILTTVTLTSKR
ncbi:CALYX/PEP [Helicoverpa armigera SNPV]|uniref:Polyhedral envelope protein n=2 Tax=Helicoverpa armigera nucleopolyhedrovirus TaxID=51313 RepID=Q8V286_9ABAC|nr:polyhedron envelope protein [Helicoverpa armigera nucleopolyhedrovirus]AIG63164.1 CALYX/PEP [Helicoverpa SNPV AC53]AIG63302.1 CALYX/PEP [Helicoverpa armigera SNPV]AJP07544.1 polyhedral envelope protein [Helicoverpa armigera nucleopolyhedrovirus]AMN15248.1 CALYX/PEP [Helicoverpa SNPV AC53]